MQNVALAMYLIYEKFGCKDSEWKPYINTLPSFYDTVAYFSQEEMAVLKHAPSAFSKSCVSIHLELYNGHVEPHS